jgi:hypothetical protein
MEQTMKSVKTKAIFNRKVLRSILISMGALTLFFATLLSSSVSVEAKVAEDPYANTEYYKLINGVIGNYGISKGQISESSGLAYVELIDFDKNGSYELYMVYLKDGFSYVVTQEIWGMKDKKAVKLFSEDYDGTGLASDRSLSLCKSKSKTYIRYKSSYSTGNVTPPYGSASYSTTQYLTLSNNKFVTVAEANITEEYGLDESVKDRITYSYKKDGKTKKVSKESYDDLNKAYVSKGVTDIIYGGMGSPAFADVDNNVKKVQTLMDKQDKIFVKRGFKILSYSMKNGKVYISGAYSEIPSVSYDDYVKLKKGKEVTILGNKFKLQGTKTLINTGTKKTYKISIPTKKKNGSFENNNPNEIPTYLLSEKIKLEIDQKFIMKKAFSDEITIADYFKQGGDVFSPESFKSEWWAESSNPTLLITFYKGKIIDIKEIYWS